MPQKTINTETQRTQRGNTEESPNGLVSPTRYADFVHYGQKRNELHERAHVTRLSSAPARFARNRAPGHTALDGR
jgi:hypothetical protein